MSDWEKISVDGLTPLVDWDQTKEVSGKLTEVKTGLGSYGSTLYTLTSEDGNKVSFFGNALLNGRFEKVELGTECKVVSTGWIKSKTGREYRGFEVYTK